MATPASSNANPLTRTKPWPLLGAIFGLAAVLFAGTALRLVDVWEKDPNYSHGWLVPIFSLVLAYRQLRKSPVPENGDLVWGGLGLLVGVVCQFLAIIVGWLPLDFLALVFVLYGVAAAVGGRKWAGNFTFPIFFLFFMFPLPHAWTSAVALWLQDWVAVITSALLNLFTVCYRRGTSLHLAGVAEPLVVAEECSGLRQIVAFVAAGCLLGYVLRGRGAVLGILLVLAAVPVAIVSNVLRVLLMAVGARLYGTDWISTWLHHAPVLFSLPVGLAIYGLVAWGLYKLWSRPKAGTSAAGPDAQSPDAERNDQGGAAPTLEGQP